MTRDRILGYTDFVYGQNTRKPSSVFNSVPLTGGDSSDLGHYCTKTVALGLRGVSVSGGLPGRILAIWREGARTKRFG